MNDGFSFKRKKFNDHLPAVDGGNPNDYLSLRGPNPNDHRSFRAAKSERPPLPFGRRKSNDDLLLQIGGNPNDHLAGTC